VTCSSRDLSAAARYQTRREKQETERLKLQIVEQKMRLQRLKVELELQEEWDRSNAFLICSIAMWIIVKLL